MLTALAGVVTAVGGLYFGFRNSGADGDRVVAAAESRGDDREASNGVGEPVTTTTIAVTLAPTNDVPASESVDPSEVNTGNLAEVDTASLGSEVDQTIDDCASGIPDACLVLLDQLADECAGGFGVSCDALFWVSPIGSEYELFGATCGYRFDESYAGSCAGV